MWSNVSVDELTVGDTLGQHLYVGSNIPAELALANPLAEWALILAQSDSDYTALVGGVGHVDVQNVQGPIVTTIMSWYAAEVFVQNGITTGSLETGTAHAFGALSTDESLQVGGAGTVVYGHTCGVFVGVTAVTTGLVSIPHGLGTTPEVCLVTPQGNPVGGTQGGIPYFARVMSVDATNIVVSCVTHGGINVQNGTVTLHWMAEINAPF